MQRYSNNVMEELAGQLTGGLLRLRQGYVEAAEALFAIVQDDAEYPYEFVVFRITGFRPARSSQASATIMGKGLRSDLMKLILDVSGSFAFKVTAEDKDICDAAQLAKRLQVSMKTIQRWRRLGLPARLMVFPGGRKRICFTQRAVEAFTKANPQKIERSARFSKLTQKDRRDILRRARRMATFTHCTLREVAKRLSARTGRAMETIRYTIRHHDMEHPDRAVFPNLDGPLGGQEKENIYHSFLRGMSAPLLAKRFNRTRGSIYRIINETRAKQLVRRPIEYMPNPQFDLPNADQLILAPSDDAAPIAPQTSVTRPPADVPPYLKALYDAPLLGPEHEQDLFRRFNYLKFKADKLRREVDVNRVVTSRLRQIEALLLQANAIKNQIVRANLRLVVSIAKKHISGAQSLFELVSDGNVTLMRAVERFDYSRGNRFSTYASWAIMRSFARSVPKERYHLDHFATGNEEIIDIAAGLQSYNPDELNLPELRESIDSVLAQLSPRERAILIEHYGLDAVREPKTLDQLSQGLGISKERVRQIEVQALKKLRRIMNPERSGLMA